MVNLLQSNAGWHTEHIVFGQHVTPGINSLPPKINKQKQNTPFKILKINVIAVFLFTVTFIRFISIVLVVIRTATLVPAGTGFKCEARIQEVMLQILLELNVIILISMQPMLRHRRALALKQKTNQLFKILHLFHLLHSAESTLFPA